jgi:phage terminase small subunit
MCIARAEDALTGPAMMALSERRRRFVQAMYVDPYGSATSWAIAAGYSNASEGAKVRGHECIHDPKVQLAVAEVARATLGTQGPMLAVMGLINIAKDPKHKDYTKAAEMILNRVGFAEKQHIEVTHRDLTGDALMERIVMLAEKHGVNLGKLGVQTGPLAALERSEGGPVIEHGEKTGESQ